MRLCRRHGWERASLQSGELSMTSAAQLETTFAGAERAERRSTGHRNVGQGCGHDQDHDSVGRTRQLGLPAAPGETDEQGVRGHRSARAAPEGSIQRRRITSTDTEEDTCGRGCGRGGSACRRTHGAGAESGSCCRGSRRAGSARRRLLGVGAEPDTCRRGVGGPGSAPRRCDSGAAVGTRSYCWMAPVQVAFHWARPPLLRRRSSYPASCWMAPMRALARRSPLRSRSRWSACSRTADRPTQQPEQRRTPPANPFTAATNRRGRATFPRRSGATSGYATADAAVIATRSQGGAAPLPIC